MKFDCKIEKEIGALSETDGGAVKKLCLISWDNAPPKYDLRVWMTDRKGDVIPCKGLAMTEEEAKRLYKLLSECFQ